MASARKIEDETEARRCLRAARLAGLSAGEWARARGIDVAVEEAILDRAVAALGDAPPVRVEVVVGTHIEYDDAKSWRHVFYGPLYPATLVDRSSPARCVVLIDR